MHDSERSPSTEPVFSKCVRCAYPLRGLPANHACPECGLRFDERCALYPAANPRQVLVVWIAIIGGGWIVLKNLRHVVHFASASGWQKLGAIAAVLWVPFVATGLWLLIKRYRRGLHAAVTTDGLIVRLPGIDDKVIAWTDIAGAEIKQQPKGKPQIARVALQRPAKHLEIGGVANVFPTRADVERFVAQVNERASAAADDAGL